MKKIEFARHAAAKWSDIENIETITKWCRQWEKDLRKADELAQSGSS